MKKRTVPCLVEVAHGSTDTQRPAHLFVGLFVLPRQGIHEASDEQGTGEGRLRSCGFAYSDSLSGSHNGLGEVLPPGPGECTLHQGTGLNRPVARASRQAQ